ncbi:MAG: hypothetical protein RBU25_03595 [Lentisphaeria bacterium]|jgi:hypothetical protein|nr:hypothetical protein [Lentisphaeria bacterium]
MNAKTREWKNGNEDISLRQVALYVGPAYFVSWSNGTASGMSLTQVATQK